MDFIIEQVFFFHFFAIHLPPVEEGEFLLYIMLKESPDNVNKVQNVSEKNNVFYCSDCFACIASRIIFTSIPAATSAPPISVTLE